MEHANAILEILTLTSLYQYTVIYTQRSVVISKRKKYKQWQHVSPPGHATVMSFRDYIMLLPKYALKLSAIVL